MQAVKYDNLIFESFRLHNVIRIILMLNKYMFQS